MLWFTSDTHFGHANVLHFTDRPFGDIAHMNRALINAINERVAPTDDLYILGDFSYQMTAVEAAALRSKINCRKVHIVPGNHDKDWTHKDVAGTFIVEPPIVRINIYGQKIVLSHYPLMEWQSMSRGSWHLHGHIHSAGSVYNELNRKQGLMRYDVGVDANDLAPVSLDEIRAWFEGVEFYGRARWWEWVNGTGDPAVAEDCEVVRELMVEVDRDHATAQESAEASRRCASALRLGAAGARTRTLAPRGAPAFTAAFASNAWDFNLKLGTVPHLRLRGAIVSSA